MTRALASRSFPANRSWAQAERSLLAWSRAEQLAPWCGRAAAIQQIPRPRCGLRAHRIRRGEAGQRHQLLRPLPRAQHALDSGARLSAPHRPVRALPRIRWRPHVGEPEVELHDRRHSRPNDGAQLLWRRRREPCFARGPGRRASTARQGSTSSPRSALRGIFSARRASATAALHKVTQSTSTCVRAWPGASRRPARSCPSRQRQGRHPRRATPAPRAGIGSDDPTKNGCPLRDKDGDGIPTTGRVPRRERRLHTPTRRRTAARPTRTATASSTLSDACPDVKGVPNDDPEEERLPADNRDGDGILDAEDACPDVKGVANEDPKKNGCPRQGHRRRRHPRRTGRLPDEKPARQIPTRRRTAARWSRREGGDRHPRAGAVRTATATIKPESDGLLDEVAEDPQGAPRDRQDRGRRATPTTGAKAHQQEALGRPRRRRHEGAHQARRRREAPPAQGYGQDRRSPTTTPTRAGRTTAASSS